VRRCCTVAVFLTVLIKDSVVHLLLNDEIDKDNEILSEDTDCFGWGLSNITLEVGDMQDQGMRQAVIHRAL